MTQNKYDNTRKGNPLPPAEHKAIYVQEMFSRIARRYDLMNRLMTMGRDRAWRRYSVAQLGLDPDGTSAVLDVATGTGDFAFEVLHQQPGARVAGLDFVPDMLELAQHKATSLTQASERVSLLAGDMLQIPFPDAVFDGVVTGFAMRNVSNIPAAFAEMARVTRPGGRVACLEIAKPKTPLFRQLFALYFYRVVPLVGGWITGQPTAYSYLPHSLTGFLTPDEIEDVMRQTGWSDVSHRRLMMGTVAVHVGTRT